MQRNLSHFWKNIHPNTLSRCPSFEPEAVTVIAKQAAEHLREIGRLDDIAFTFLRATDGNELQAERSLENCIDALLEGGALSMWRYRIVLNKIREGL